jgi:hypothetical protein
MYNRACNTYVYGVCIQGSISISQPYAYKLMYVSGFQPTHARVYITLLFSAPNVYHNRIWSLSWYRQLIIFIRISLFVCIYVSQSHWTTKNSIWVVRGRRLEINRLSEVNRKCKSPPKLTILFVFINIYVLPTYWSQPPKRALVVANEQKN